MHAGASAQIDVDYGARTPEGVCQHNGYCPQRWVPRVSASTDRITGAEVTSLDPDPTRWLYNVTAAQRESRTCLAPSPTSTNQPPRAGSAPLCLPRREGATLGPGAVGSVSKGEGQSRQTDQVEISFQAATFCLVANGR